MLDDLGVSTNDFNTGQAIYLVFFLAAELPGGLISKKLDLSGIRLQSLCFGEAFPWHRLV